MATTDYGKFLSDAIAQFIADGDTEAFYDSYRSIPSAARGPAQIVALPTAGDRIGDILSLLADVPSGATRTTSRTLTDEEKYDIRQALTGALEAIEPDVHFADSFVAEALSDAIGKVQQYVEDKLTFGTRAYKARDILKVAKPGDILTGQTKDGATVEAVVNADGSLTSGSVTGSVSAVAGHHVGRSQNGWTFWSKDGVRIDSIQ